MTNVKGPIISFADLPSIEAHLSAHEGSQSGFWLKLAKAGAPEATITKAQAIEAALCHGWIDGQLGKFDEHYYLVRMTPRRSASRWSAINRDTAERLIREARMQPAGLSEVQKAMADGRWNAAYQSQGKAEPPSDFLAALAANAEAERAFATLDRANRYAFVYRVNDAKRPETRNKRIREFVEMLARGDGNAGAAMYLCEALDLFRMGDFFHPMRAILLDLTGPFEGVVLVPSAEGIEHELGVIAESLAKYPD